MTFNGGPAIRFVLFGQLLFHYNLEVSESSFSRFEQVRGRGNQAGIVDIEYPKTVENAAVDDIVLYAAEALEDITIAVVNALHPGVPRTGVDDWLSFTVAVVTNLLGSQKRRRPGVGA